jgi:phosphate transport system substrate-binding protein
MKFTGTLLAIALAGAIGCTAAPAGAQQQVTGAGSTFVYPVLSKWSAQYAQQGRVQVNYQSIGSGGGIAQIKAGTVDFGASDMPLPPQDLAAAGLAQFPVVIGADVPVVNLPGIRPGDLKLTGALLADIFLGTVKMWNDPAIAAVNPDVKLPATRITVVHRSDGSGTTFIWVNYLSKVSPQWRDKVGEGTSVAWPTGIGGKGNEGVAAYVQRIQGSVGYLEYAYVMQNKMTWTRVQNAAGAFVAPNKESFQAAAASADWSKAQDFFLVLTNAPGEGAFPIAGSTSVLMHRQPKDAARTRETLGFFRWALEKGQEAAEGLDYIPLPAPVVQQIEAYWQANIHAE